MFRALFLTCFAYAAAWAASPALAVDANANRHAISPWIYGINEWSDNGLQDLMHIPLVRWGGDDATSYNWQKSVKNNTGDNPWLYENYAVTPNFDAFHESNLRSGTVILGTVSLMDWTPKAAGECSFSVSKYGPQKATNPDNSDCGNGVLLSGAQVNNDPNDAYSPVTEAFSQQWVQHIAQTYGQAQTGGVSFWSMDNEPEWWWDNHVDVYKNYQTYDDTLARNLRWAKAVKAADPTALITGPVPGGWSGMLFSFTDMTSGWSTQPYQYWDNPVDQKAHGGVAWIPYYLQQMKTAEAQNGQRLLDVLDVHAYINPQVPASVYNANGTQNYSHDIDSIPAGNAQVDQLRMTATRAYWDPAYIVPNGGIYDATGTEVAPMLVPRMHSWVNQNYPGTKLAITEYMLGALNDITGAIAQADLLGIFGRESLDIATLWGPPNPGDPGAYAFQMFLNYDGAGNQFGETSISATSDDPDTLSIFAAQRSDTALTILVLNKTANAIDDTISLANFMPSGTAQVWQYSSANLHAIAQQPALAINSAGIATTFPPYSMTLIVAPASSSSFSVAKPVIGANGVVNAASYDASGVAPGEIVTIFGSSLAPQQEQGAALDSTGKLATSLGGVRVLFEGFAAPLIYTFPEQVSAIVPYEIAPKKTVHVQVENHGNRSDAVIVPVVSTLPGIFTVDGSGTGQGAILNQDLLSVNGPANPAHVGDYVHIYATGEGVTSPPGVDGRIANAIYPGPVASPCVVTIGGLKANVTWCKAAPGGTAGEIQVDAQVPQGVTPGSNVPVQLSIGGKTSKSGVTMAVQ